MAKTIVHENESIDDALRRFKRSVSRSGTLQEYRKREFYEKPSVRRKLKSEAARKRRHYSYDCSGRNFFYSELFLSKKFTM